MQLKKRIIHTRLYINSFSLSIVYLCKYWLDDWLVGLFDDLSVDGWVNGWLDTLVPNWALLMLWCKWDESSITQNAWPTYNLSFHANFTVQPSVVVIITNSNFSVTIERCRRNCQIYVRLNVISMVFLYIAHCLVYIKNYRIYLCLNSINLRPVAWINQPLNNEGYSPAKQASRLTVPQ